MDTVYRICITVVVAQVMKEVNKKPIMLALALAYRVRSTKTTKI